MSNWVSVDFATDYFPNIGACYCIYLDGELMYVGSTFNLKSRIDGHCKLARYSNIIRTRWGPHKNVTVKYRVSQRYGDWAMLELQLIRKLKPKHNKRRR